MIFVILGFIILVVSFVFALISLIREQSTHERSVAFHKPEGELEQEQDQPARQKIEDVAEADERVLTNGKASDGDVVGAVQNLQGGATSGTAAATEPFPWETSAPADQVALDDEGQRTVEEIRKELAKINFERENRKLEEKTIEDNREEELTSNSNLSGEVSISDLVKGSSEG